MQLPPGPIITRPLLFRAGEEPEIVIEAVNATGATDYHWLRPTSIGTRMSLNDLTRLRQQAVADGIPHFELKAGATPLPIPSHSQIAIYRINSDHMQVEADVLSFNHGTAEGTLALSRQRQYFDRKDLTAEATEALGEIRANGEGQQTLRTHIDALLRPDHPEPLKSPLHLLEGTPDWLDGCLARMPAVPTRPSLRVRGPAGALAF